MSQPVPVELVIFDLDGTVLDTETLVVEVANAVLSNYGTSLTSEALKASTGKRPLEAWQGVVDLLGLSVTAQQLLDESEPLLKNRWCEARTLPGARRLVAHLRKHNIPLALATSTPRTTMERKLSGHSDLQGAFQSISCGDEVLNGKPAPDCFELVAKQMGVRPAACLVLEDAPAGVKAATAAGMRVVVIPSIVDKDAYPPADPTAAFGCVAVLPSLLDFHPEQFNLPPFQDIIAGEAIPLDQPVRLRGPVVKGFGRGSRELGIRTANLDAGCLACALAEAVTGIFFGWAAVGADLTAYQMVMSIGWNPYYSNREKTAEPWILHDFKEDFYGEELRLVCCGYIRPEADFTSLEALIARIHRDAEVAKEALSHPLLAKFAQDPFLKPTLSS